MNCTCMQFLIMKNQKLYASVAIDVAIEEATKMKEIQFDYFKKTENEEGAFCRIPKILFTEEMFAHLSTDAKVLYAFLLDRMELSEKNNWYDEMGQAYIYFIVKDIAQLLNCSEQKAVHVLQELDTKIEIGLVEKKRQGLGKPSLLYVKRINMQSKKKNSSSMKDMTDQECRKCDLEKCENMYSKVANNETQECAKMECNNTDNIQTNNNKNENNQSISSYQSSRAVETLDRKIDWVQNKNKWREILKRNISYEYFVVDGYPYKDEVDELINIMAEVMVMPEEETIRIERKNVQVAIVQDRFLQYEQRHIEYVLNCLKHNKTKITNIKSYLRTTLYNAPLTVDNHCRAEVNYNMNKKYGMDR